VDNFSLVMQMIGHNLKRIRKRKNISREKLARKAGISPTTIASIESGERNPSIFTLCLIAGALGIRFIDLVAGEK
jgi:XRE family transcriptional regulator, regulator of sulfur utilization